MLTVHLLSCGGTLEKIYSESTGSVVNLEHKVNRYLERLRLPDTHVIATPVMNKDSLDMTDEDRRAVLDAVRTVLKIVNAPIVITHGTDTMVETGLCLKRNLTTLDIPVIMTGAMTPLGFENSDGLQNLTESLFAARILPPGVWLVMHSQYFPIDQVRKDRSLARFVPSPDSSRDR
jgi:L-asparaginase